MDDPNPYTSPQSTTFESDDSSRDPRVMRGRTIILVLIAASLALDLFGAVTYYHNIQTHPIPVVAFSVIAYGITYGLWYAVWQGRRWAVVLTVALDAIGALDTLLFEPFEPRVRYLSFLALTAAVIISLTASKSVRAFLQSQRSSREGPPDKPK